MTDNIRACLDQFGIMGLEEMAEAIDANQDKVKTALQDMLYNKTVEHRGDFWCVPGYGENKTLIKSINSKKWDGQLRL